MPVQLYLNYNNYLLNRIPFTFLSREDPWLYRSHLILQKVIDSLYTKDLLQKFPYLDQRVLTFISRNIFLFVLSGREIGHVIDTKGRLRLMKDKYNVHSLLYRLLVLGQLNIQKHCNYTVVVHHLSPLQNRIPELCIM